MINKVTLLGRIGKKVYKQTRNGSYMSLLSIKTCRRYIDSKGNPTQIDVWHSIHAYNKLSVVIEKGCNVGELIYLEGEIINKQIEENGQRRYISYIVANEVTFLPNMKKEDFIKPEESHGSDIPLHMDDEEIPF